MATSQFMGANSLIDRLTAQVGSRETAIKLLRSRGQMEEHSENLTAAGKARDAMTAEERAKDRASKLSGKKPTAYSYDPKTNRATLARSGKK
jgi:hypothetical protein